jgi:hypothetical protein
MLSGDFMVLSLLPAPGIDELKLTNERIARMDAFPPPPSPGLLRSWAGVR